MESATLRPTPSSLTPVGLPSLDLAFLASHRAGRFLAAGVILAATAYQLTAAKAGCLERCRDPRRSPLPLWSHS